MSFLSKKGPLLPIVLTVLITVGAITSLLLVVPQFSDGSQLLRDYSLAASPSSLSMTQGSTATTTVTASSVNGFDLSIGMTASVSSIASAFLVTTLSSNAVTPSSYGKATATLTVVSLTGTPARTYEITLASSGGTRSHTLTISVTVGPQDFTLAANPSSMIAVQGSANTSIITVTSEGGFSGNVSLTVTAPSDAIGIAGGPSPVFVAYGSFALSLVAVSPTSATAPGSYTITVTGTAGGLTHSISITLTVKASTITTGKESLNMDNASFTSGTNATIDIRNTGTVNVTLVAYYVKDPSGDQYSLTSWSGPSIAPNTVAPVFFLIGSSCPGCTLTGTAFTFQSGYSYTITVVTARNNLFSFTITR